MAEPLMQTVNVTKASGMVITVDRGRKAAQSAGLTQAGVMDEKAFLWANRLLNNAVNAAALEVAVAQLQLIFQADAMLAICGAKRRILLNGNPLDNWQSFRVRQSDVLDIGWPEQGVYSYLAIAGGFIVPLFFQSACCVVREQLGGHNHGLPVKAGDELYFPAHKTQPLRAVPYRFRADYQQSITVLRVWCCYQYADFSPQAIERFFSQHYSVSTQADRMGYRLQGDAISVPQQGLISEGIAAGSIQIANDGLPIVLMRDRQTMGGYPKIGTLLSADIEKLAQLTAGAKVQFVAADIQEGLQERIIRERFFAANGEQ